MKKIKPKILLYAFAPYLNFKDNASQKLLESFKAPKNVVKHTFSVNFNKSMFLKKFELEKPNIIIGMGQHPRARKLRIERRAINQRRDPKSLCSREIHRGGPASYFATCKIPSSKISTTTYAAGNYVCNFSMYISASYYQKNKGEFAFLHIPRLIETKVLCRYLQDIIRSLGTI